MATPSGRRRSGRARPDLDTGGVGGPVPATADPARCSRLEAALEHMGEAVIVWDERGREVYRNGAAGEYVATRLGGAVAAASIQEYLATALQGQPVDRALELFAPARRVLSIRTFPLSAAGAPLGAAAIVEDVSERKRVDAMRRDFVANVSHELKTPVGALSLLAETLDGEDDPEVVTRLSARLATEADRLARIIDDLLDLSRIEANEEPMREPVQVSSLVAQSLEGLRPMAEAGRIALVVGEIEPGLTLVGDRWELVSALANLVDNAIKYSEPDGRVEITAHTSVEPSGEEVVEVTVSDRGIGIPARDLERVFERFYRVDRARSRSTGGTGLGLSIVRHVVANHGGTVRLKSLEGAGSSFTLVLPRPAEGASGDPKESARA